MGDSGREFRDRLFDGDWRALLDRRNWGRLDVLVLFDPDGWCDARAACVSSLLREAPQRPAAERASWRERWHASIAEVDVPRITSVDEDLAWAQRCCEGHEGYDAHLAALAILERYPGN